MASTATRASSPSRTRTTPSSPVRKRKTRELSWLRASDARLVISHQEAQDRRILKALDTLVKGRAA